MLTLAVLAGAVTVTARQTRGRIREQIAGRDGALLHAVALLYLKQDAPGLIGAPEDPANLLAVALETSRLKGVLGVRVFDRSGSFLDAFPADLIEGRLTPGDLPVLALGRPVSHFHPAFALTEAFLQETPQATVAPVLEVNVPLHLDGDSPVIGIVQFLTKGDSVGEEFARLDRNLWFQATVIFVVSSLILIVAIAGAFRRLNRAHRLLAERTERLIEANQELALAARISAVGAVASHLIHGLRNPLAGLQNFVSGLGSATGPGAGADLEQAVASTRRMQTMINEVVAVLRDEQSGVRYEVSLEELAAAVAAKARPLCRERGVEFLTRLEARVELPHRVASLTALILGNLAQNAVEATPRGGQVRLHVREHESGLVCEVHDEGPGFPADRTVFAPGLSVKEGGSGIGLAICKQLAHHLGASLDLKRTSPGGCVFALVLPLAVCHAGTASSMMVARS